VLPLSAHDLLAVWERGAGRHPTEQAFLVLAAGYPELSTEELWDLPLGEVDARLVALRAATLGPSWEGYGECPSCRERVEFPVPADEILARWEDKGARQDAVLQVNDMDVEVRWPTSRDLAEVALAASVSEARRALLHRSIVRVTQGGAPLPLEHLPAAVEQAIAERFDAMEENGEILLDLACPRCGHAWRLLFDPGAFFWTELVAQARRLFHDVHSLARAYGWQEADILAMSPQRRQAYLAMVDA